MAKKKRIANTSPFPDAWKIKSPLSCVFGCMNELRQDETANLIWLADYTSVEYEPSAQLSSKQRGRQTSGAAL